MFSDVVCIPVGGRWQESGVRLGEGVGVLCRWVEYGGHFMEGTSTASEGPLLSTCADDPEMRELIELFVSELAERREQIRSAWEAGDVERVRLLVHRLRGSSAGYGFAEIGLAAGVVEERIKALGAGSDRGDVAEALERLVALCGRVRAGGSQAA